MSSLPTPELLGQFSHDVLSHTFGFRRQCFSNGRASPLLPKPSLVEGASLYKGSPQLLQQIPKALTVEGDPLLILKSTQLTARNL